MEKTKIKSFYQEVITNRVRDWKAGELMNCEYEDWIIEVFYRLQGLGLSREESAELINQCELSM